MQDTYFILVSTVYGVLLLHLVPLLVSTFQRNSLSIRRNSIPFYMNFFCTFEEISFNVKYDGFSVEVIKS